MHLDWKALEAGLDLVRQAPADAGPLELIVRRPAVDEREIVETGMLDLAVGLVGDTWQQRGSSKTADGSAHPDKQVTVMNSRAIALMAGSRDRWHLAGDQLYVDLDIGVVNLPAGSRLRIDGAVLEVTEPTHTGCHKFSERFGTEAVRFVNSPEGKALRLRGLNTRVLVAGPIRVGALVRRERPRIAVA